MSHVIADPELMTWAAADLASIGSNISAAHMAAVPRTLAVIPAAADKVSAGIAGLFSQFGQDYQALAAEATAFQEQFEQLLTASAGVYADIEGFIASYLGYTIATEQWVVNDVVAMPALLLNPVIYLEAALPFVGPPLFLLLLPVEIPLAFVLAILLLDAIFRPGGIF